jgi:hydrogenase maturation protein HypF
MPGSKDVQPHWPAPPRHPDDGAMTAVTTAATVRHERLRIRVKGAVQGAGFRPFVHGLAVRYNLSGSVQNDDEGVLAEVEGVAARSFLVALSRERPPLARIDGVEGTSLPGWGQTGFSIHQSASSRTGHTGIVPDTATCIACRDNTFDSASRFHMYPFVSCTDYGPRFTIIGRMPYERRHTSMAGFPRCADCARDFADPANRRFQSETSACRACGPRLSHPIADIQRALAQRKIVAVKGVGGFHLFCDAANEGAVQTVRRRKDPARHELVG